jgi:hypothetical protein
MTSRLSAIALIFAVLTTTSLAVATTTLSREAPATLSAKQVRVVELEHVVVIAKRVPREAV